MTKKELLEILSEFQDYTELVFTQETEKNAGEVYDMYLDNVTVAPGLGYANLYFKWVNVGE